jgi:hypothetical protein
MLKKPAAAIREIATTPLYGILAFLIGAYALLIWPAISRDVTDYSIFITYNEVCFQFASIYFFFYIFGRMIFIMVVRRPRRLAAALLEDIRANYLDPVRWLALLVMMFLLVMYFPLLTIFKSHIGQWHPYDFDPLMARIDAAVHGGRQAWQVFLPLAGFPAFTLFLSTVYGIWFAVKFVVLYWQAFDTKRPRLRAQFFLTLVAAWMINGSLLALLFASVGPCFYGRVYPGIADPYQGLMAYLHGVYEWHSVSALNAQDYIWNKYAGHEMAAEFAGISAFPSIHVSIAFLLLLLFWEYGRAARIAGFAFFMLILFGSIMLGWHYAIDGYFSVLDTLLIWLACGWAVRKYELHRPRMPAHPVKETAS